MIGVACIVGAADATSGTLASSTPAAIGNVRTAATRAFTRAQLCAPPWGLPFQSAK